MDTEKYKFPGFIDGLKASNITINKTSLMEYSEQILSVLNQRSIPTLDNPLLRENLQRAENAIKYSLKDDISTDDLIQQYIKFGDIIKSYLPDLKSTFSKAHLKELTISYLKIAKYTKDSRITDLAISVAKDFE
jgi:hypothetical protein